jgi:glycine cleavage system H protein
MKTVLYRRCRFSTRLPDEYRYSPTHCWVARRPGRVWRVGLTRFAVRLLGELVEHGFDLRPGQRMRPNQAVGWIEGFKAIVDLPALGQGRYERSNPLLEVRLTVVNRDPYGDGWLYEMSGGPILRTLSVQGYLKVLDRTIDLILEARDQRRERGAADPAQKTTGTPSSSQRTRSLRPSR